MPKPSMLTPIDAAEHLGIKVIYLYKLIMRRVIPYYPPEENSDTSTAKISTGDSAVPLAHAASSR